MEELLLRIFNDLEQEDIRYCLLRDFENLDQLAADGDVDILIGRRWFAQFASLLTRRGFVRLPSRGHDPHHFFITYNADSDRWLKLDVVTEVAYGRRSHALRTALADHCLANRRRHGSVFIPSPEDELVTLLLHCVLDKGEFELARCERLTALRHQVTDERYLTALLAGYWSPTMTWPQLAAHIDAANWTALLHERSAVAARLARRDPLGTFVRTVRDPLLRKLDRWSGLLRPRAVMVALLAPDGAGKSTLAAGIQKSFYFPVHSVYMGLYQQNGPIRPTRAPVPGVGLASRLVTQWRRYLTARYHQARGWLVVCDRYTYDALLTPHWPLNPLRRARRWLLAHACPAPDLVLILDAPGEVLYARKGEHSPAVLEQQRQGYLRLQPSLPQSVVVNAARDADQVRHEVTALIWDVYARRLARNGER